MDRAKTVIVVLTTIFIVVPATITFIVIPILWWLGDLLP